MESFWAITNSMFFSKRPLSEVLLLLCNSYLLTFTYPFCLIKNEFSFLN